MVKMTEYVLNLSPNKRSRDKSKDCFYVDIETQTDIRKGICLSPSKRKVFEEAITNRTGCEISNVCENNDFSMYASD